jgi:ribosome-associated protein
LADPTADDEDDVEESGELSRTRARDQARAYLELADELVKGKHPRLLDPPFDAELRQAIADARRFEKNARTRQIRLVAQLLRADEIAAWRRALAGRTEQAEQTRERERLAEQWRTRLLEGGDAVLGEFVAAHPGADRQRLRQLVRQATGTDQKAKRAATQVLRAVRELITVAGDEPGEPDTEPDTE